MVLERLVPLKKLRKTSYKMFFITFFMTLISAALAYESFRTSSSILFIAFITMGTVPLIHKLLAVEERLEVKEVSLLKKPLGSFLARHYGILKIYAWFFLGVMVASSVAYVAVPTEVRGQLFEEQLDTITAIDLTRSTITGKASALVPGDFWSIFSLIFSNNASVLATALIFSFIYGTGAIFLITWNATILGTVIGEKIIEFIKAYTHLGYFSVPVGFAHGMFTALGFVPHGLPEILSYFIAGLAGGIISIAVTQRLYRAKEFKIIAIDTIVLVIIAYLLLFAAALIEAYALVSA